MALYEHVHIQRDLELMAQLFDACSFSFSTPIGEKYERNSVGLEVGESAVGSRERFRAAEEDAIDAVKVSAGKSVGRMLNRRLIIEKYILESKSEFGHLLVASC